jgi:hypothetical protein
MRCRRIGCIWMCLIGSLCATLVVDDAHAFVRTRTCDRTGTFADTKVCRPDQEPMLIAWTNPCITYYINRKGSPKLGGLTDELLATIQASFDAWENVSCSQISFALGGLTCNENIGREDQDITGGNQNLLVWQEENWAESTDAIAVTVVSPNPETGEILDADILMNGQYFNFAILSNPNDTVADVQNTLTHEIGHLIGFNHETTISEATMFPNANPGELSKRDLHPDDMDGLCQVYPGSGTDLVCVPTYVQDLTCRLEYGGEIGCATTPTQAATRPVVPSTLGGKLWVGLLGLFGICGLLGRRRRRSL